MWLERRNGNIEKIYSREREAVAAITELLFHDVRNMNGGYVGGSDEIHVG